MAPAPHDHVHGQPTGPGVEHTRARLAFALILTAVVLVAEVAGGIWSNSLALLSDAAHVSTDFVSLALSFGALMIAARPVSKERTFGWHRAEVLAALINGLFLFVIGIVILREAYARLWEPPQIRVGGMLVIAVVGLLANGIIALRLRTSAHADLNVRSAYLHVIADLAGSAGVVVAAGIILVTGWHTADPIISALIAAAVLVGSLRLLRDSVHILLEGVPRGVKLAAVAESIRSVPGVEDIHDLHIWTICSNILALSVHATVGDRPGEERDEIVRAINELLAHRFGITETTVQTECEPCRTDQLLHIVPHHSEPEHE